MKKLYIYIEKAYNMVWKHILTKFRKLEIVEELITFC